MTYNKKQFHRKLVLVLFTPSVYYRKFYVMKHKSSLPEAAVFDRFQLYNVLKFAKSIVTVFSYMYILTCSQYYETNRGRSCTKRKAPSPFGVAFR